MGILSGNPKNEPLHYGEVFGIWSFLFTSQACVAAYQTMLNHAGDGDLKELIHEAITASQEEVKEVAELLKENGVGLPPSPPARPVADLESIPAGARFMDNEIAAKISADIAAGLITCSTMMGQAIREILPCYLADFTEKKRFLAANFYD